MVWAKAGGFMLVLWVRQLAVKRKDNPSIWTYFYLIATPSNWYEYPCRALMNPSNDINL